ncbi:hypothetical protein M432DRAFT_464599 [Thermoascus aurantiacus ATCC 26904]
MSNVMSILLKDMRKAILRFSFLSSLSPLLLSTYPLHFHSYFSRVKSNGLVIQLTRFRPGGDIWIDEIRCATEHMYVCMYAPSPSESHNPYMPIYTYTIIHLHSTTVNERNWRRFDLFFSLPPPSFLPLFFSRFVSPSLFPSISTSPFCRLC